LPFSCPPQDLFSLGFFARDPSAFFRFMHVMDGIVARVAPTPMHRFLAQLSRRGRLRRLYSQNIDGLEAIAGIDPDRVVLCHGDAALSSCTKCGLTVRTARLAAFKDDHHVPYCDVVRAGLRVPGACHATAALADKYTAALRRRQVLTLAELVSQQAASETPDPVLSARVADLASELEVEVDGAQMAMLVRALPMLQRQRDDDDEDDPTCDLPADATAASLPAFLAAKRGVMKPHIVFFGEQLPDELTVALASDVDKPDLVIVVGTSLQVAPVSNIPAHLSRTAPIVVINRESLRVPGAVAADHQLLGNADVIAEYLAQQLGWDLDAALDDVPVEHVRHDEEDEDEDEEAVQTRFDL
jgi:NAD-dependent SIR2 family protein deacetylase